MSAPAPHPSPGTRDLAAQARAEQRDCWHRGDRVPAEFYLDRYPALRDDPEAALDLIYGEVLLREQRGETPDRQEYLGRFPAYADRLERQFALQRSLRDASPRPAPDRRPAPANGTAALPPVTLVVPNVPEADGKAVPHGLQALRQAVRAVEPAAVLVPEHLLERVIRQAGNLPAWVWRTPHPKSYVVDRHVLFRHVEQEELDLGPDPLLPATVILIAQPSPEELAASDARVVLLTCWRRLFHASVHLALERSATGALLPEAVRARVEAIGPAEFEEVRQVLAQDNYLLPTATDRDVYAEFAAVYLEMRYFAPGLVASIFPGLGDRGRIDQLLARDLDAGALFVRTRLPGAAEPGATPAAIAEPPEEYSRLMRRAERAAARGNCVQAAILHTRAARVAPPALTAGTRAAAEADLQRLGERLRDALRLGEADVAEWRKDLPALLDKADQGRRPVEAALLYDLQNVCLDQERDLYALGLVESVLSAGRRPVKRPLPSQRLVRPVRTLQAATGRLPRASLADAQRDHLAGLLAAALRGSEDRLRDRFRPMLHDALHDVGLGPANPPERIAFDKMIDELLDRIVSHGFLTFSDLRDTISRNQLKLPDLASPVQFARGDELLRLDRRLAVLLDGVYRASEFYVRWLEGLSALGFGTPAGRVVTRYAVMPFGGAFVFTQIVGLLGHLAGLHVPWFVQLVVFLVAGAFLFGLLHVEAVGRGCVRLGRRAGQLARAVCVELPARLLRIPAVRQLLASWPVQLCYWYVLKPLVFCALLWPLLPAAVTGPLGMLCVFLAANFVLNSRLGGAASELLTRSVVRLYELLRGGLVLNLYRLVVRVFKRVLDTVEYLLFCVDEWLRYRSGDGWLSLTVRTVLGVVWFPVGYVARFYMVVLIEPLMNPLKFPVCSVAAKLLSPFYLTLTGLLGGLLSQVLGGIAGYAVAGVSVWLLPNAFGFLFWETKENWRLYRANRRPLLGPAVVGGHGETMVQLLRPGFHSGTVPKLYARLRRAERRALGGGDGRAVLACREALEEVEGEVRRFVSRELVALLRQARSWRECPLDVGHVTLALNRVGVELIHGGLPERPLWLEFEERARWLVASVREPGWLEGLTAEERDVFLTALAGLYKRAGVELVRDQLQANLPAAAGCDLTTAGLVVWQDRRGGRSLTYDLREGHRHLQPREADGLRAPEGPVLDADRLVFARLPLPWRQWVDAWEKDQAGAGHPRLFDAKLEPVAASA
jgi:hypothetical protein